MQRPSRLRRLAGAALLLALGGGALAATVVAAQAGARVELAVAASGVSFLALLVATVVQWKLHAVAALASQASAKADMLSERLLPVLDALSQRLLRVEARLSQPAAAASPANAAAVVEVSSEISLLGELIRDLAVTLAAQDRDMAVLKDQVARASSVPSGRPTPPVPMPASAPPAPRAPENPITPTLFPRAAPAPEAATPARETAASEAEAARQLAIVTAFERDRIELHLQPIVSLPQRKVRLYEALVRLRLADETLLVPAEFLPVLERRGLTPDLDRKVLIQAAAVVRHLASRGSDAMVACNLGAASLAAPGFLRAIGGLLTSYAELSGRLVIEIAQRSWRDLDAETAGGLAQLRDRGLAFALDKASDLRIDALSLADRGVRYVKLPAEMLLASSAPGLDVAVGDLAAVLARAGIKLVAERVEREEDVPNLLDLDVPLAQGFVFAPPRAVRAEVLTGQAPEPAPAPGPGTDVQVEPAADAAAPTTPETRVPFRSFLRRAT